MKKIFAFLFVVALMCSQGVSAQSGLSGLFGKIFGGDKESSSTENTITNVLGSLLGGSVKLSERLLEGTWE